MEFSKQEYWSGLLVPSPEDLPDPGIKFRSPAWKADSFTVWATREVHIQHNAMYNSKYSVCVHVCVLVTQSCQTLCHPTDYSPPGFSVHGLSQARIPERVAISSSRGYSQTRDQTLVSRTAGRFFTVWATREGYSYSYYYLNFVDISILLL